MDYQERCDLILNQIEKILPKNLDCKLVMKAQQGVFYITYKDKNGNLVEDRSCNIWIHKDKEKTDDIELSESIYNKLHQNNLYDSLKFDKQSGKSKHYLAINYSEANIIEDALIIMATTLDLFEGTDNAEEVYQNWMEELGYTSDQGLPKEKDEPLKKKTEQFLVTLLAGNKKYNVLTDRVNDTPLIKDGNAFVKIFYRKNELRINVKNNSEEYERYLELNAQGIAYQKETADPNSTVGEYAFFVKELDMPKALTRLLFAMNEGINLNKSDDGSCTCPRCGCAFKPAKRCPECGQLFNYGEKSQESRESLSNDNEVYTIEEIDALFQQFNLKTNQVKQPYRIMGGREGSSLNLAKTKYTIYSTNIDFSNIVAANINAGDIELYKNGNERDQTRPNTVVCKKRSTLEKLLKVYAMNAVNTN